MSNGGVGESICGLAVFFVLLVGMTLIPLGSTGRIGRALRTALLTAFLIRAAVGVLLHYFAPYGLFAEDNWAYSHYGLQLADYLTGKSGVAPNVPGDLHTYYYWNAAIFMIVGFAPLVLILINCFVGALVVWLAFQITLELGTPAAALRAAWLTALFPSLVLWSSLNLRDVWVLISILAVILGVLSGLQRRLEQLFRFALPGLIGVYLLREYLVFLLIAALAAGYLLACTKKLSNAILLGMLLAAAFVGVLANSPESVTRRIGAEEALRSVSNARRGLGVGSSAYLEKVEFRSGMDVVRFIPLGSVYFLLGPFPWNLSGLRQYLTLPEMLYWYYLIPMMWRGIYLSLRYRFTDALIVLSVLGSIAVPYILVSSNLGTAYRHRAQVSVLLLSFASVGLAAAKPKAHRRTVGAYGVGMPAQAPPPAGETLA